MASIYGITMRKLDTIDETHSACPLVSENCSNYKCIYNLMIGLLYHNINDLTLQLVYDQNWNQINSNLLGYDGFEVMDDALFDILPKLNLNSAKISTIQRPVYNSMEEDNLYSYIDTYNTFLRIEKLAT